MGETLSNLWCPKCHDFRGFTCSGSGNSGTCNACGLGFRGRFSRALMDKRTKEQKYGDSRNLFSFMYVDFRRLIE